MKSFILFAIATLFLYQQCIVSVHGAEIDNIDEMVLKYTKNQQADAQNIDGTQVCQNLANAGKCVNDKDTRQFCPETCKKWKEKNNSKGPTKTVKLDVYDGDFYELQAKLFNSKKTIDFDRFDGYLTVICNIGKVCTDTKDIEATIKAMQSLFKLMPYSLNMLLFPYEIPSIDYTDQDCSDFETIFEEASKSQIFQHKLFFMEEVTLNGVDVHPVYEFLKKKTDTSEMMESHATFYFINGEGTKIDVLEGASFDTLRTYIVSLTKEGYGGYGL